jgi:hypothetical protein
LPALCKDEHIGLAKYGEGDKMKFQPYTYVKCIRGNMWTEKYGIGDRLLFLGYITNPVAGDNALFIDARGHIMSADIKEEDWEIMVSEDAAN